MRTAASLVTLALLAYVALQLARFGTGELTGEGRAVELASLLGLVAALALWIARGQALGRGLPVTILLAALAAREMDLDKAPFERGILSAAHYTGGAPLWQKAVGLLIVAAILWALWRWARGLRPTLAALRQGRGWAWALVLAVLVVVVAKSLDGIGRKLAEVGITITRDTRALAEMAEESLELGFALLLVWCVALLPKVAAADSSGRNVAIPKHEPNRRG